MSLKRLPLDDLAVAKPVGPRALALLSDLTRFDPPDFGSPEPDHGVAFCDEALREDAWPHVLISGFNQSRTWSCPRSRGPPGVWSTTSGSCNERNSSTSSRVLKSSTHRRATATFSCDMFRTLSLGGARSPRSRPFFAQSRSACGHLPCGWPVYATRWEAGIDAHSEPSPTGRRT